MLKHGDVSINCAITTIYCGVNRKSFYTTPPTLKQVLILFRNLDPFEYRIMKLTGNCIKLYLRAADRLDLSLDLWKSTYAKQQLRNTCRRASWNLDIGICLEIVDWKLEFSLNPPTVGQV